MHESTPLNLREYGERAKNQLVQMAWDYYSGGSGDELTLAANEAAWRQTCLHYRVLTDIASRSTRTQVLGYELSMPVLAAPTAFQKLAHPDGEIATTKATTSAGTAMILSSLSTVDVEDVMKVAEGPVFFQLYMYKDRNVSRDLIRRVEAAGCKAIILTVDAPLLGNRERDERNKFELPKGFRVRNLTAKGSLDFTAMDGSGLTGFVRDHQDPTLNWKHVDWLRQTTNLPIVIKGLCRPDDAVRCFDYDVQAIVVSNHGGRQLDGSPATFDVLPSISDAVGDRGEIWIDGGIRRGTDVIKAIAAGANATLIGRPILWGLADSGEAGVRHVWSIMQRELDLDMALCGCRSISEITPDLLDPTRQI